MCKREMTLGEEIIGLSTRGIDTPTVERMYRKYIEMTADKELAIKEFINSLFGVPAKSDLKDAEVGDKTTIKLDGLGEFAATVHKVTDDKVMLIFDDYVAERPMNESDTNKGGFEYSDLNEWLHTEFVKAIPYSIRARLTDVTIPTVGEMFGWDDEWNRNYFEADNDKQLPLMKQRRNRVAYYNNECECGWLRNATKKEFSAACFAAVCSVGSTDCNDASVSRGVRPEIWLVK
ncbi:DUF6273 domain-containing protein [Agathobacter rectalis]|uniref:DUF6273 domain-containing protein n=1 Tax=Agathobacter rectalis TaxID=39491 RepID=A0A413DNF4_9FIRM|nr:DUF6273 domain-containing protein [Agathobacter rectalis]RGW88056.1 hypothetical protein DWV45_05495 [Agathobacter rectalis]